MGPKEKKPPDNDDLIFSPDPDWPELTDGGEFDPGTTPGLGGPTIPAPAPSEPASSKDTIHAPPPSSAREPALRSVPAAPTAPVATHPPTSEGAHPTIPAPPSVSLREMSRPDVPPESGPRSAMPTMSDDNPLRHDVPDFAKVAAEARDSVSPPRQEMPTLHDEGTVLAAARDAVPTLHDAEEHEGRPTLHDIDPIRHDLPGLDEEWDTDPSDGSPEGTGS